MIFAYSSIEILPNFVEALLFIGYYDILSKLATVIYPLRLKKQTLEILLYLSFKLEHPANGLQDISCLVLNLSRRGKTVEKPSGVPSIFRSKSSTISATKRQLSFLPV